MVHKKGIFPFWFTTTTRQDNNIMETAAGRADNRMALITLLGLGILWIRIYSHHQPALIQSILVKYQWVICPCKDILTASPLVFVSALVVPLRITVLLFKYLFICFCLNVIHVHMKAELNSASNSPFTGATEPEQDWSFIQNYCIPA